jgi:hypothetical protein
MLKSQCLEVNAVAYQILLFLPNISMSYFMPFIDRNAVVLDNKPTFLVMEVLTQAS